MTASNCLETDRSRPNGSRIGIGRYTFQLLLQISIRNLISTLYISLILVQKLTLLFVSNLTVPNTRNVKFPEN